MGGKQVRSHLAANTLLILILTGTFTSHSDVNRNKNWSDMPGTPKPQLENILAGWQNTSDNYSSCLLSPEGSIKSHMTIERGTPGHLAGTSGPTSTSSLKSPRLADPWHPLSWNPSTMWKPLSCFPFLFPLPFLTSHLRIYNKLSKIYPLWPMNFTS